MSTLWEPNAVNLQFFYAALGSKDQKLYDTALQYLEDNWLIDGDYLRGDPKYNADLDLFQQKMYHIIFEGTLKKELQVTEEQYRLLNFEHEKFAFANLLAGTNSLCVWAIFMCDEQNRGRAMGRSSVYPALEFYGYLVKSDKLDSTTKALFKYSLYGRALADDFTVEKPYPVDGSYYGYLYQEEIKRLLEALQYFKTEEGQAHLKSLNVGSRRTYDTYECLAGIRVMETAFEKCLTYNTDLFYEF